jgi:hypothetical protein
MVARVGTLMASWMNLQFWTYLAMSARMMMPMALESMLEI